MNLAGRTAIITGASQGLGAAIAGRFLTEGANVVLCARNADELEAQRQRLAATHGNKRVSARPPIFPFEAMSTRCSMRRSPAMGI